MVPLPVALSLLLVDRHAVVDAVELGDVDLLQLLEVPLQYGKERVVPVAATLALADIIHDPLAPHGPGDDGRVAGGVRGPAKQDVRVLEPADARVRHPLADLPVGDA